MSEYKDHTGDQYVCNSWNSRNVDDANKKLGYNNLSDKANCSKMPQGMKGPKVNKQQMGGKFGY